MSNRSTVPSYKLKELAEQIGDDWLESLEHMSVCEMLIDKDGTCGMTPDELEDVADDVYERIKRAKVVIW